ncbi:MAG: DUF4397 domain-containing protein [Candidatus Velthaea sp.]
MRLSRAVASLLALPAALSLAACGGGSPETNNFVGAQSQMRFIDASPDLGAVDLYLVTTGTSRGVTPTVSNASYGMTTDFAGQNPAAGQVLIFPAGNTTTAKSVPCSIPQMQNNGIYTIVIAGRVANNTVQCLLFHELAFTATGQVRVHHASPTAAQTAATANMSFGFYTPPTPGATVTSAGQAQFQGFANTGGTQQAGSFDVGGTSINSTTATGVAAGPAATGTFTRTVFENLSSFVAPGTTAQPDTTSSLPSGTFGDASVYIVDCTAATTPQGNACTGGVGLLGVFDTK